MTAYASSKFSHQTHLKALRRMRLVLVTLALLSPLLPFLPNSANAQQPALDFTSLGSGRNFSQGSYSLGWNFTVTTDISVSSLGFYDDLQNGLSESHAVGIFDFTSCEVIASTTVTTADPLTGFFRYHEITPVTLSAGKSYYIAAVTGSESYAIAVTDITIDPTITYGGFSIFGNTQSTSTLSCPNGSQQAGFHGDYGPNFLIGASTPPLVTPKTTLADPPTVVVAERQITLTFQLFSGVGNTKAKQLRLAKLLLQPRKSSPKMSFDYVVEIKRESDADGKKVKNQIKKITTKRNQITVRALQPGNYSARYRVRITKKSGNTVSVVGNTKFSPAAGFSIS